MQCAALAVQKYEWKTGAVLIVYTIGPKAKFLSFERPSIESLDLFCEYFGSTPTL